MADSEQSSSATLRFHLATRLGDRPPEPDRLVSFRRLDPANEPSALKRYVNAPNEALPRVLRPSGAAAVEVLSGRVGPSEPRPALDDELLGTLLYLAGGVTRAIRLRNGKPVWFRTAMSAGNLHPIELYVVRGAVEHYDPLAHSLVTVRESLRPTSAPALARDGGVTLVLTGLSFRTCWKYGERGWRHVFWDAGTILANLLAAAAAHHVATTVRIAFDDDEWSELLGLDRDCEEPVVLVDLGFAETSGVGLGAAATARPLAPTVLRFPLVDDAAREGALSPATLGRWLDTAGSAARAVPTVVDAPQHLSGQAFDDPIEAVILRRGSTRAFKPDVAANALLEWGLVAAALPVGFDISPDGTFLEHFVGVHAVDEVESGGYRYHGADGFAGRLRTDDVRSLSRHLCVDQALGGDSAFTAFHCFDLAVLERIGARGYRVAQLEAGVVAGRLSLCASALGYGATGLTFFDRAVSSVFDSSSSPMLATAVGLPVRQPARSGSPGAPAWLALPPTSS